MNYLELSNLRGGDEYETSIIVAFKMLLKNDKRVTAWQYLTGKSEVSRRSYFNVVIKFDEGEELEGCFTLQRIAWNLYRPQSESRRREELRKLERARLEAEELQRVKQFANNLITFDTTLYSIDTVVFKIIRGLRIKNWDSEACKFLDKYYSTSKYLDYGQYLKDRADYLKTYVE